MVWDLGRAMRKKEEFESSRLLDFEFRLRARAMRMLAERVGGGIVPAVLAQQTVTADDDAIVARLVAEWPDLDEQEMRAALATCHVEARRELIDERGDPTPYRLG